jgi:hypothetical protein
MHAPNYMEVVDINSKFRPSGILAIFNTEQILLASSNFVLRPHKPEWSSCSYYSIRIDITTSSDMNYISEVATIMYV